MDQESAQVSSIDVVGPGLFVLGFRSPRIAAGVLPGQFINIKVNNLCQPLLRRPFSVYRASSDNIFIVFNIVGAGTRILAEKKIGDTVDLLGPLGRPFGIDSDYETALLVGGGLGVAPLPLLTERIGPMKTIVTFLGARSADQLVRSHLKNLHLATDDGTAGLHGTVVDLLRGYVQSSHCSRPKIFACGPNPMLRNLSLLADEFHIECEVSLESVMACGIGLCQGCPVENAGGEKKYSLICKDGPVFNSQTIRIP